MEGRQELPERSEEGGGCGAGRGRERKEAVMGWQDAQDSWGIKMGRGVGAVKDCGEAALGCRNTEKAGSCQKSGPENQVRWGGLGIRIHCSTWLLSITEHPTRCLK